MANNQKEKKVLIRIENLKQYFPLKKASLRAEQLFVRANDDVTLDIYEGETLGLVGESGCGKSTLGRTLLQIYTQTDGRTIYYGRKLDEIAPKYVMDILNNLPAVKKDYIEATAKYEAAQKEFNTVPDGSDEKYTLMNELRVLKKEANDHFINMVQLIGGFYLSEDLNAVSKVFIKEHQAELEARKVKNKIQDLEIKIEEKSGKMKLKGATEADVKAKLASSYENLKALKKELEGLEKKVAAVVSEIEAMKKPFLGNPEFEKLEKYRDKGVDLAKLTTNEMKLIRKDLQLIFQDPYSSLNPRMTVGQIISEGLHTHKMFPKHGSKTQDYVLETMDKCGLAKYFVHRYPHQFSGGQRQRIGIARSVALKPKFIVCDEAVSALDVSIQSQVINLLEDLKAEENLTYLFISHDLSVIKYISDRVGVMYLGNIVELTTTEELYSRPMHPYTEALMVAIPTTDVDVVKKDYVLEGDIPSPIRPPSGCKFHTRCRYATDICKKVIPEFEEARPGHFVACHHKLNQ